MHFTALVGLAAAVAPLAHAAQCSAAWQQCGGNPWSGSTCCPDGYTCEAKDEFYSQCVPNSMTKPPATTTVPPATVKPPTTTQPGQKCAAANQQCGGDPWSGPTCCPSGYTCEAKDEFYSQCIPNDKTKAPTTAPPASGSGSDTPAPTTAGPAIYTVYENIQVKYHDQAEYPNTTQYPQPGHRACPSYCSDDFLSEGCTAGCKNGCTSPPAEVCGSGTMWGEQFTVGDSETWHYSRSTHFGLTNGGACGFGYYGLCTKGAVDAKWVDPMLNGICDAFCKAYPILCQDPKNTTLRGNFAAPNGDYYTQFWPHLDGEPRDNYLSCGECFEQIKTKPDGTDYKPGEEGYTDPIILEVVDSCPCSANSKWCCGSGYDHCAEINFTYGCPIPKDSHHMDLSDIAMGRLAGNGDEPGLIPIRYKRVPCPKPGNIYIWLRDEGGPYYFALSVVNTAGVGSITKVEIKGNKMKDWVRMVRDPNYTAGRPQERYGSWVIPQGSGPFNFPIAMRITSPNGEVVVNNEAIKTFTPPATAVKGFNYIDFGTQFTLYGKQ